MRRLLKQMRPWGVHRMGREWEEWGDKDPYYAVLSTSRYRANSIGQFRDEFFRTGEDHAAKALSRLEARYGAIGKERCLDFGCGVGRVMLPLARRFAEIVGLDVSDSMLAEAQRNLESLGVTNAKLGKSDDRLSCVSDMKFDFVHSYITLQHIPAGRGYLILARLLDLLKSDGAFFLQFCVGRKMPILSSAACHIKRAFVIVKIPTQYYQEKAMERAEYADERL